MAGDEFEVPLTIGARRSDNKMGEGVLALVLFRELVVVGCTERGLLW